MRHRTPEISNPARGASQTRDLARQLHMLLAAVLLLLYVPGCSSTVLTMGAAKDGAQQKTRLVSAVDLTRFPTRRILVLHLHDGTSVVGVCVRHTQLSEEAYRTRYDKWLATSPAAEGMPGLGERVIVRVARSLSSSSEGDLVAFEDDGVVIQEDRSRYPTRWTYKEVTEFVTADKRQTPGEHLSRLRRDGTLPLITAIDMETTAGLQIVPLDEVRLVRMPFSRRAHAAFKVDLDRLRVGNKVGLLFRDGEHLVGRYAGTTRHPYEVYRSRYESWRDSSLAAGGLPRLGRRIQVRVGKSVPKGGDGEFAAFTNDGVAIGPGLKSWRYGEIAEVVVSNGDVIPGTRLIELRRAGDLPVITALQLDTVDGGKNVAVDQVVFVSGPSGTGTEDYVVMGVAVVVVGVIVLGIAVQQMAEKFARGVVESLAR